MAQYTKKAIISTFLELVNKQSLDKITVKDIVDRCEINRNTFYYYYKDIYDLIENIFQMESQNMKEQEHSSDLFYDELKQGMHLILEYRTAIAHMYYSKSREVIVKYLDTMAGEFVGKYIRKQAEGMNIREEDLLLVINCYGASLCGVVLRWVQGTQDMESEAFVYKLSVIYESTIKTALLSLQNISEKTDIF